MKIASRFAVWLVAALSCGAAAAAAPCQLQQVGAIVPFIDQDGTVLVPVSLDGHEGYMALQLNSGLPVIFEGYVDTLGLRERLQRSQWDASVGGRKITHQAKVGSTLLGRINFSNWTFQVVPRDADSRPTVDGKPLFGIMTSIFMNVVDLELNLAEPQINLFKPNKCSVTPVYWDTQVTGVNLFIDASGLLLFPIEVEGKRFEGSLNTTSGLSVISSDAARRFLGFDEDSPGIEREVSQSGSEIASFRAMSLTAKGLDVRNARVRIKKMPRCSLSSADRNSGAIACGNVLALTPFSIGTDLMRKLRIYVSAADKKIYFTRASRVAAGPAAAAPADVQGVPGGAAR